MAEDERRTWWMYRGRFFWEDDGLAPDEVMALVHERERRLRRRIDRAKDLMLAEAADAGPRREPIPEDVRRDVFRRDGGRCAVCGDGQPAPVRPRDPGGAGRGLDGREPAAAVRAVQPRKGRVALVSAAEDQATATLAWMRDHGDLLREIVREDLAGADDLTPGGDPNIRAHLRFVAMALRADAAVPGRPTRSRASRTRCPRGSTRASRSSTPTWRPASARSPWRSTSSSAPCPAPTPPWTPAWSGACASGGGSGSSCWGWRPTWARRRTASATRCSPTWARAQRELARLIFSLDLQAKNAAREAAGGGVDVEVQDQIGQAAAVQGHMRLLVEAIAEALAPRG